MSLLSSTFLSKYEGVTPPWGFGGMGEVVYLRTYSRKIEGTDRTETWVETIKRIIDGAVDIGVEFTQEEAESLFDHMFNLRCTVAGRALWQLGTPLVSKFSGTSLNNCFFTNIEKIEDFELVFDYLMLGGGVGFSVERSKIHDLPKVKEVKHVTAERSNDADFIVPDSRQGWRELLHKVLEAYFITGKSFTYSTVLIREFGAPLKTFGGTASGPGALVDGVDDICKVLNNRVGKKLRSIDVLDICNIIGRIVVSGSSRRSAQIAIGDPDDILFLRAKNWASGSVPAWRANSNNSIYADSYSEILTEIWKGYDGSGEPYGLVNRKLARSVGRLGESAADNSIEGFNPCAEIALADGESCNLSTIFLPNVTSLEQLKEISILLYKVQKQVTRLSYPYEKTNKIVHKNARLGQSITGILQCNEEKISWLSSTYENLKKFDKQYSKQKGWNSSVRLTTVQPSGTLSLLPGVTPGIHPAFAKHYIRRVRFGSADPLVDACRKRGYKVVWDVGLDGREDHTRYVVEFPCKSPEGSVLASEMTAIQQLEWVKKMQTVWADNAVSVTVYYRKEELSEIKKWLEQNYDDSVKSVSFLLHSDHNFPLPPYEEISEEEYNKTLSKINFSIPLQHFAGSHEIVLDDCATGACPIK
jgi:ribonucleotide reductase alpha subunit